MKKEKRDRLIEECDELRNELAEAFTDNKIEEYDKLNCRLQRLEKKIRKGQK